MDNLRELLGSVDGLALSVEVLGTHSVWVEIATVGIAVTSETVIRVSTTAAILFANVIGVVLARMWGNGESMRVGLYSKKLVCILFEASTSLDWWPM
jgi:hypothetical protein